MAACRLCGANTGGDLVTTLDELLNDHYSNSNLVFYFCEVDLSTNENSNRVCKKCKNMFSDLDEIKKYQLQLKKHLKPVFENYVAEIVESSACHFRAVDMEDPLTPENNNNMSEKNVQNILAGTSIDSSYLSIDDDSSASGFTNSSGKRNVHEMLECYVSLERLNIEFETSDASSEESDDEVEINHPITSTFESSYTCLSPSKRMRLSAPHEYRLTDVSESDQDEISKQPLLSTMLQETKFDENSSLEVDNQANYREFFETILDEGYKGDLASKLTSLTGKDTNEPISESLASRFAQWITMKLDCTHDSCDQSYHSPFDILVHKTNSHPELKHNFIDCPLCDSKTLQLFSFSQFIQHVHDTHSRIYSFCCVCCPKMFYNYQALFNHYHNYHPELKKIHMCIKDGLLFDSRAKFWEHVEIHEKNQSPFPHKPHFKKEKSGETRAVFTMTKD